MEEAGRRATRADERKGLDVMGEAEIGDVVAAVVGQAGGGRQLPAPGDRYEEGLLVCGKCGGRKETWIQIWGQQRIVRCVCKCQLDKYHAEQEKNAQKQSSLKIRALKDACFPMAAMNGWNFRQATMDENLKAVKRYADKWPEMKKKRQGLLFYGDVGTGKTYAAVCVANAVMEQGYSCIITSVPRLVQALDGNRDKVEFIDSVNRAELLILDDLGTERASEYMNEQVYGIIDGRYRTGKPLIVTTNLALADMVECRDGRKRIYDRILELCYPIRFSGQSRRRKELLERSAEMKKLLGV
ncbi:ATP-binding protein [Acidaminococcus massiliensis]|uniref:ATP-binding protein n=1 Tax=Acidaminococcus massiliensis TaxID=1852375 RepID=UPI0022E90002|nr:ATP-binding protein [Acidaminococcus massiliensis]